MAKSIRVQSKLTGNKFSTTENELETLKSVSGKNAFKILADEDATPPEAKTATTTKTVNTTTTAKS